MKNIKIFIIIFLLIVAVIVAFKISNSTNKYNAPPSVVPQDTTTEPFGNKSSTSIQGYTMAEVATHNSKQSCWTVISGSVYDLTDWISAHPGGERAILGLCGIDGTAAFEGQHGGQARPASELAGFKIGALK